LKVDPQCLQITAANFTSSAHLGQVFITPTEGASSLFTEDAINQVMRGLIAIDSQKNADQLFPFRATWSEIGIAISANTKEMNTIDIQKSVRGVLTASSPAPLALQLFISKLKKMLPKTKNKRGGIATIHNFRPGTLGLLDGTSTP
jgi:hypothetical protein